jgi:branched-chain amino acid transport system ATP-binding protein
VRALRVDGLFKYFGGLKALQNISFSVETGERRGIIGPNGAGKTSLFNLITGQLLPDAGHIYMFERDVTTIPIHRRIKIGLGRTFQVMNLLSNLTVIENVVLAIQSFGPSAFGMFRPLTEYEDLYNQAKEVMVPWGLWEKRDMLVRDLSYGEQRCLDLILSMASNPKLLLLDEPTCGMTPNEVIHITKMIQGLGKNIAIVLIAHDMDLIFGLNLDRVTVLHYGQIVTEGSPQDIRGNPKVREIYLGSEKRVDNAPIDSH